MIIKNNTDIAIERHKQRLGLTGDVYLIDDKYIESLESHKKMIPSSVATTIDENYETYMCDRYENQGALSVGCAASYATSPEYGVSSYFNRSTAFKEYYISARLLYHGTLQ